MKERLIDELKSRDEEKNGKGNGQLNKHVERLRLLQRNALHVVANLLA